MFGIVSFKQIEVMVIRKLIEGFDRIFFLTNDEKWYRTTCTNQNKLKLNDIMKTVASSRQV